jgi:hypothetical protein
LICHLMQGHEPFVSYEGLEQLHRLLFILGITHVLYSFVTVVLSMIKVRARCPFACGSDIFLLFFCEFIVVSFCCWCRSIAGGSGKP